ncbi:chromosome segregation SMC family protein [Patescibacteria group bacterium]
MYLDRIEIQGFKSFADKTILKFNPGMTAVVGPNGSGKSNIADAVRWVLGEQSKKMLRSKSGAEVIFAGSKDRPKMSEANVILTLTNEDGTIPLDASEVSIGRRINSKGESDYLINDAVVRLQDVIELLAKAGFGQRTYSVIGQGRVDEFVKATPLERKALFEEAAGVKQYQLKKDQALRKLDKTRNNLVRVSDLLTEIKPRLNSLKRQAARAAKREEVEKELNDLQVKWFTAQDQKLTNNINKVRKQEDELLDSIKKSQHQLDELVNSLTDQRETRSTQEIEREELETQIDDIRLEKNHLAQEVATTRGQMETAKNREYPVELQGLAEQKDALANKIRFVKENFERAKKKEDQLVKELSALEKEQTQISTDLESFQKELTKLGAQKDVSLDEVKNELENIVNLQGALVEELAQTQDINALADLREKASNVSAQLKALHTTLGKQLAQGNLAAKREELQNKLQQILDRKNDLDQKVNTLRVQSAEAKTKAASFSSQGESLKQEYSDIESKLKIQKESKPGENIELKSLQTKLEDREGKLEAKEAELANLENELDELKSSENSTADEFYELEEKQRTLQQELTERQQSQSQIEVERTRHEVHQEDLRKQIRIELPEDLVEKIIADQEIIALSEEEDAKLSEEITALKKKRDQVGAIDPQVMLEFQETEQRYTFFVDQSKDLQEASQKLRQIIKELDQTIKRRFQTAFKKINTEFDKHFKILFNGGTAKLIIIKEEKKKIAPQEGEEDAVMEEEEQAPAKPTEADEALEEADAPVEITGMGIAGVDIKVNPPGKKLTNLTMLSGGEKALTSIALLSAIIATNPSPFVVLDEVDAALDEANSQRFAEILTRLTQKTQFIVVTHNRETMRQTSILYGVTMQKDGVSKLLSIQLEDVKEGGVIKQ